jgi:hypothetical protein
MESYFLHRLTPDMGASARRYLRRSMEEAGVRPLFSVVPPDGARPFHAAGHDVCVYTNGRGYLVGVMQNRRHRGRGGYACGAAEGGGPGGYKRANGT